MENPPHQSELVNPATNEPLRITNEKGKRSNQIIAKLVIRRRARSTVTRSYRSCQVLIFSV